MFAELIKHREPFFLDDLRQKHKLERFLLIGSFQISNIMF